MNTLVKSLLLSGAVLVSTIAFASSTGATSKSTACVDGKKQSSLVVTWNSNSNVTVGTVNNKPLCDDLKLHFSSYTMPDNYNGKPFNDNPTATPQTIFDDAPATLKKGETKPVTLSIKLPEACKNIQVDVYYAPKLITVSKAGHGSQYISGKIISKTADSCTPVVPVTPEVPTPEAQEPEAPKPVVVIPTTPTELPETGSDVSAWVAASVVSLGTYLGVYFGAKRR